MTLKFNIHSITPVEEGGGGGGGDTPTEQVVRGSWVVPQAVLDLETAFNSFTKTASLTYKYGMLITKGIGNIIALTFDATANYITSDGSTGTYKSNKSGFDITFSNPDADNWIVFETKYNLITFNLIQPYGSTSASACKGAIRYFIVDRDGAQEDLNDGILFTTSNGYNNLESFTLNNTVGMSYFNFNKFEGAPKGYIPPATNWNYPQCGSDSASTFNSYAHLLPNLPYGYDMSQRTDDFTLGVSQTGYNRIKEAYIKLPSGNFQINGSSQIIFSKDNWEYIATNAPTVSSKTLSMGSLNISICGGAGGTIISTLTGKGWIVN